jgi:competence protein ComEA
MNGSNGLRAWRGYIGLSLVWLAILGAALFMTRRPASQPIEILPPPTPLPSPTPPPSATPGPLRVDVAGAVRTPGVYALPPGSVVADAIMAAGGPVEDADLNRVNKAVPVQDGMQVYVPRQAETQPPQLLNLAPTALASAASMPAASGEPGNPARPVNLNTASPAELDTLPGVGPATAQRIIDGRPYSAIEDLMRVKGIGQATFDKLKDYITVK